MNSKFKKFPLSAYKNEAAYHIYSLCCFRLFNLESKFTKVTLIYYKIRISNGTSRIKTPFGVSQREACVFLTHKCNILVAICPWKIWKKKKNQWKSEKLMGILKTLKNCLKIWKAYGNFWKTLKTQKNQGKLGKTFWKVKNIKKFPVKLLKQL